MGTTVCVTCSSQLSNCGVCEKSTLGTFQCLACDSTSVWTGSSCLVCSIPNCQTFAYSSGQCVCTLCDVGYAVDSSGNCALCSSNLTSCLECTSLSVCTLCDPSSLLSLNSFTNLC